MPNKATDYNEELLCGDIAKSDESIAEIALKYKISASTVYKIAAGKTKPELKVRIDELIQAEKGAGMRLAKSRARFAVGRLVQIAQQDEDRRSAIMAIEKILEMGGMLTETGGDEKQTIEVIFSAKQGEEGKEPLAPRLTGVYTGNN